MGVPLYLTNTNTRESLYISQTQTQTHRFKTNNTSHIGVHKTNYIMHICAFVRTKQCVILIHFCGSIPSVSLKHKHKPKGVPLYLTNTNTNARIQNKQCITYSNTHKNVRNAHLCVCAHNKLCDITATHCNTL